jgi:hypothetical protein
VAAPSNAGSGSSSGIGLTAVMTMALWRTSASLLRKLTSTRHPIGMTIVWFPLAPPLKFITSFASS